MRDRIVFLVYLTLGSLVGCSGSSTTPTPPVQISRMYISDSNNNLVDWYLLPVTASSTTAGSLGATNGINGTIGLAFDAAGNLYAANHSNGTVTVYAREIGALSQPVATIHTPGAPGAPCGAAIDPTTGNLWVSDNNAFAVYEFTGPFTGSSTPTPVATITAGLSTTPCYMTFDAAGDLFVANVNGTTVAAFTHPLTNGMAVSFTLSGMISPAGMGFDAAGNLYVASCGTGSNPIYKFNAPVNANATPSATDPGANTTIACADGATVDPGGNFWVGDFTPGRFLEFPIGSATFATMTPSLVLTPGGGFTDAYDVKFGP